MPNWRAQVWQKLVRTSGFACQNDILNRYHSNGAGYPVTNARTSADSENDMKRGVHVLSLLALFTVGCNSVSIRQPLGDDDPAAYKSLAGTWANEDGQVIESHLSKRGQLFAAAIDWDDTTDKFKVQTLGVRATK